MMTQSLYTSENLENEKIRENLNSNVKFKKISNILNFWEEILHLVYTSSCVLRRKPTNFVPK